MLQPFVAPQPLIYSSILFPPFKYHSHPIPNVTDFIVPYFDLFCLKQDICIKKTHFVHLKEDNNNAKKTKPVIIYPISNKAEWCTSFLQWLAYIKLLLQSSFDQLKLA